jgi:predicted amidohydrolase
VYSLRCKEKTMRSFQLAVIQASDNHEAAGLHTDPFLPGFRFDDALKAADSWLGYYGRMVEKAAAGGARCVLLSEDITHLWAVLTYLDDRSIFRRIAEHQAEAVPRGLGALAGRLGIHLCACYFRAEGGDIFNVAELFGPDGKAVGTYRKVHLPPYERWQVSAGGAYPVFETELGRIGMLICYDQNWPEAFAALALGGAELVLHPSAATVAEYRMLCRCSDHHVFYATACPRGSMIAAPVERILARAADRGAEVISAEIDGSLVDLGDPHYFDAMYSGIDSHRMRELQSRRPDTYSVLTAPVPPVLADGSAPLPAETEAQVREIYERHRAIHRGGARGEESPYHWDYWRAGKGGADR